jgi:hypothetical protein
VACNNRATNAQTAFRKWNLCTKSEAEKTVLCKHLDGKALFTAILRLYAAIHREMRDSLLEQQESAEEFREQRRRKRNCSEGQAKRPKPTLARWSLINNPKRK